MTAWILRMCRLRFPFWKAPRNFWVQPAMPQGRDCCVGRERAEVGTGEGEVDVDVDVEADLDLDLDLDLRRPQQPFLRLGLEGAALVRWSLMALASSCVRWLSRV